MKRSLVLMCVLTSVMLSIAGQTNMFVSVVFENLNAKGKTRQFHSPKCLIKCGERTDSFSYCGAEELTERILGKFHIGQSVELSIVGYSSPSDIAKIFAILNLKNLFVYVGRLNPESWSSSNVLRCGALDRLVFFAFSEARAIYRRRKFETSRPFQSDCCVQVDKLSESVFNDCFPSDFCISNIVQKSQKVIETRNNIFFPDIDCLLICSKTEPRKILAACHFVGRNIFPFEGRGRALSPKLQSIINERFIRLEFEKRLGREFGAEFDNLSGDALVESIYNSPNKDRVLEMLHSDIAETRLGELDYLGSTPAVILSGTSSMPEVCSCNIFSTSDRRLLFLTYNESALCVWMIFDKAFWEL